MAISYRTRRHLRNLLIVVLVLAMLVALSLVVWLLWLDRFVVYSRDGASLDFSKGEQLLGEQAIRPGVEETVPIYYNEGDQALNTSIELTQMQGFYISTEMLLEDPAGLLTILKQLPEQTPVLIELKDIAGRFYYETNLGPTHSSADLAAIKQIIDYMDRSNLYAIAKVPAFRDYYYGLENVPQGLANSKGYLWMDENRCYWLRPDSDSVILYLTQIVTEIKDMGFSEVVFGDFRFPQTDKIVYKLDKTEQLHIAANRLVEACVSDRFAVSFLVEDPSFQLPGGRTRMYLQGTTAGKVNSLAASTGLSETDIITRLVFLTDLKDTRFDVYSVLRPITSAQLDMLG